MTFLVPAGGTGSLRLQGRAVAPGDVVVLFEGDELDCRSSGPAALVWVSAERRGLEAHVRALLGRHLSELRLQGQLSALRADRGALLALGRELAARAAAQPRVLHEAAQARTLEANVVSALLSGVGASRGPDHHSAGRRLARRAEAWLRSNLAEAPNIAALCAAMGASERRLHDAFRRHLDVSPKAYLKALRLNAARHDLLRGRPATRVTDVALDWGFGHFGWFSQDYRRLFGETPSQTLQHARGSARPALAGRAAAGVGSL
jgi:AraC family ethanolamine operon transcriptional activator